MKRLFLTLLLCLLIFCGIADARMLQGVAGAVSSAPACSDTVKHSFSGDIDYGHKLLDNYTFGSFTTTTGPYTMTKTKAKMRQVGTTQSVNMAATIYADDGNGKPTGSALATSTNTVLSTSISATYTEYTWEFAGLVLNNATRYHVVFPRSYTDGSNAIEWAMDDAGTPSEAFGWSSDSETWAITDGSITPYIVSIACE